MREEGVDAPDGGHLRRACVARRGARSRPTFVESVPAECRVAEGQIDVSCHRVSPEMGLKPWRAPTAVGTARARGRSARRARSAPTALTVAVSRPVRNTLRGAHDKRTTSPAALTQLATSRRKQSQSKRLMRLSTWSIVWRTDFSSRRFVSMGTPATLSPRTTSSRSTDFRAAGVPAVPSK